MIALLEDPERGGSPSVEAAILAVVFGLLIAFAIAGGRLVAAEAAADHAARAAARAASLQRDPAAATAFARTTADASLAEQGLRCAQLDVDLDTSQFSAPPGTPASVTASVRCAVDWAELGLPASGGPVIESVAASPLDRWRERT
ncbi:TadE/TadG family type IV pilus assembly protein [Pseudonocardia alni]|uniref:TadE/TadG family type IV pilus assembly protein n=1 Tax=Pseudonocardia alni TaxID=33907 RepID=UPI00331B7CCF